MVGSCSVFHQCYMVWGGWDVSRYDVWVVLIGSTLPSFYYYLSISQHLTFILLCPVGRPLIPTSLPGSEIKAAHHKLRCRTMGAGCKQGTFALPLIWINAKISQTYQPIHSWEAYKWSSKDHDWAMILIHFWQAWIRSPKKISWVTTTTTTQP